MAKNLKLSPWHDGSVKPVHVGYYQVKCKQLTGDSIRGALWNGYSWNCQGAFDVAMDFTSIDPPEYQNKQWRGVLK